MTAYSIDEIKELSRSHAVLLFDRDCILCSRFVKWIITVDSSEKIKFLGLQQVRDNPFQIEDSYDSVILYDNERKYEKSDVTFQILLQLGRAWHLLYPLKYIPRFIRDAIYMIISDNRYKWFGRKEQCLIMTDDIKGRFL